MTIFDLLISDLQKESMPQTSMVPQHQSNLLQIWSSLLFLIVISIKSIVEVLFILLYSCLQKLIFSYSLLLPQPLQFLLFLLFICWQSMEYFQHLLLLQAYLSLQLVLELFSMTDSFTSKLKFRVKKERGSFCWSQYFLLF